MGSLGNLFFGTLLIAIVVVCCCCLNFHEFITNLKILPPALWCPSPCGQPGESIQDQCVTDPSFLIMRWRPCIACFNGCCCQVSIITTIIFIQFITTTRLESRQLAGWCLLSFSSFPSSHSGSMMSLSWGNKWWFKTDNITVMTEKMQMVDAFNTLCLLMKNY